MNKTVKRYLVSTIVSFLTGAGVVLLSQIDNITMQSFQTGAYAGFLFSAARAGLKAVLEFYLHTRTAKKVV